MSIFLYELCQIIFFIIYKIYLCKDTPQRILCQGPLKASYRSKTQINNQQKNYNSMKDC